MSPHNVTNEQLVQFVLAELPAERAGEIEAHLRQCESCRRAVTRLESLLDCAARMSALPVNETKCESANREVLLAARKEREQPRPGLQRPGAPIWRIVMKTRTRQLAVAATVAVAAIAGLHSLIGPLVGGTITFAQVIQPILNARTVVVDMIVGRDENAVTFHDVVKDSKIRRTVSNMKSIVVIDLDAGRMLTLEPEEKTAVYVDIQGPIQEGTRHYLGLVREIVARVNARPDVRVKNLGRREIDGREALGFQVGEENTELTIWADPQTALPRRIEVLQGQSFTILKNIEFDVAVNEADVSMDVPAGYALHETPLDMREFTEQDFIETLRLWTTLVLDGKFPESLRLEDLINELQGIGEKIGQLDMPGQEKMQLGMRLWRGYSFFHVVAHDGRYGYGGRGARLGEADKPVFWYQPQGSATWRVIYADLHAAEAKPENLPK